MRAVVQRVSEAQVKVAGELVGSIDAGLCLLVGVMDGDTLQDARYLAKKVACLRVFSDDEGRMNLNVSQVKGEVLSISQFTLAGDVRKGHRPGFGRAMEPQGAEELFELFCEELRS
ncbi:MAG: D-aminoacyl-tRNA deacylase, partial [Polyangiaceae bacterium]|nr:D-aminoacyl-tRNA deacylase [Polyangiaceae bacterium]